MRYFYISEIVKKDSCTGIDGIEAFVPKDGNSNEVLMINPSTVIQGVPYYGFPNDGDLFFCDITKKIQINKLNKKKPVYKRALCFKEHDDTQSAKEAWIARMPTIDSPEFSIWASEKPEN